MSIHFQEFQRSLAQHLRDPRHSPRPAGVPARRSALYSELVFNNLRSSLAPCFPVCRQLLGEARWQSLCRSFLRDWPLHTPWFREIPREFTRYLRTADITQRRPACLAELAHYEWIELAVDIMDATVPPPAPMGDLLSEPLHLNPTLMNLAYAWPVHRIGQDYRPRRPQACHLLVYRSTDGIVRFTEISPSTARLVTLLATTPRTGSEALQLLAAELQHPEPQQLLAFGQTVLTELFDLGILLGRTP